MYNFSDYKGVYELEEYRDIDKKVFVNEDNKLEMAIYGDAVHYLKDNHYIDIDNTLVYDKENKHYTNVNNFYKVVFPDDISDNQIQINYYDYSIRQRIMDVQSSNLHPIDKIKEKKDDIKELSKVTSGVIYKNINKHIDIQYSLKGQSIKEEIVLHRYKPNFSMIFEFELEYLVIENYYGIYYFINNDGEKVSNFSNLIMIDNNGVLSDKVYLDVKKTADNIYQVTISADNEFLLNANYPVTIDPSIDLSYTGLTIQAKQIYRDYGSSYYALVDNPQYLNVSRGNYGRIVNETYIGFSGIQTALSNIKKIDNVILELNVNTTSGFASKPIAAYEILNYSYSQIGTSPISLQTNSIDIVDYSYGDGIINFDFTNTIKYWLENYINSRAIRILSPQSYSDYSFNIYGTSNPKMNLRPALRVYYGSITGMVPYQDYSSYETSTGNLFINNSSLMPTYVSNDYISDSLQISHIYNNIRLSDINYGFGINWNLNINKEFCFSTSSYMINADGYETWYSPINEIATDGSESTYSYHQYWPTDDYYGVDNDSSDTSINLVPENQSVIFVKTKDNIQYEFRKFAGYLYYKLVKIINLDINGNRQNNEYLTITYIKDNGLWIDSINLYSYNENTNQFNKTQTAQLYYTNNKLYQLIIKKINDNGLLSPFQSLEYNYDSNNPDLLSNINISYDYEQDGFSEDDKKDVINFSYSNNLNLLSIDRVNFDRLEIIYSKTKTVQKVIKKNGSLLIDQFTFLRHEDETVIIDKNGNKTTKRFDELDRFVGSTNHLGIANNISYYDHGTDNINYHNIHKVIGTSSYVEPYTNLIINGEFEYDETSYNDSPYYWGLENNNINIGSASIYTCTSDIDLCKNRVNSGKKSLQISKYTPLVDYMLYQYVYVREGYYSLSAYVSGSLTIEIDEGLDIVVYSAFGPVDNSENPNMVFKRLVFYSNGSSLTRVKIRFEDNQIGDAFIDDIKLTPVVGTELTNLVVNSSFEDNFTNYTGNVEKATIVSDEYTLDQKKIYGAKLVKMEANLNSKSIKQNIYIPSIKGTKTFTFGGTIRTDFKSITEANASIKLVGHYVGGHQKSFTLNAIVLSVRLRGG